MIFIAATAVLRDHLQAPVTLITPAPAQQIICWHGVFTCSGHKSRHSIRHSKMMNTTRVVSLAWACRVSSRPSMYPWTRESLSQPAWTLWMRLLPSRPMPGGMAVAMVCLRPLSLQPHDAVHASGVLPHSLNNLVSARASMVVCRDFPALAAGLLDPYSSGPKC